MLFAVPKLLVKLCIDTAPSTHPYPVAYLLIYDKAAKLYNVVWCRGRRNSNTSVTAAAAAADDDDDDDDDDASHYVTARYPQHLLFINIGPCSTTVLVLLLCTGKN